MDKIIIIFITYSKGTMKPPLTPLTDGTDAQWPPTVGLPLSASTWELARAVEKTDSGREGGRRGKKPKWKMGRTGGKGGGRQGKEPKWKMGRTGGKGGGLMG
jgi:hypothetical protein